MPAAGAWTNGQTMEPARAATRRHPALVPKHDDRQGGGGWVETGRGPMNMGGRDGGLEGVGRGFIRSQ